MKVSPTTLPLKLDRDTGWPNWSRSVNGAAVCAGVSSVPLRRLSPCSPRRASARRRRQGAASPSGDTGAGASPWPRVYEALHNDKSEEQRQVEQGVEV
ncbi:MAG: hypothetical protein Q7K03_03060, partial [Dehalococcoidia bacterium]|nr:hypothetical protein [Dehalococcoidia bacterium]